jgi:hypothetical protein
MYALSRAVAASALALSLSVSLAAQTDPIALDPANPHYFHYHGKTIALITSGEHYGAVLNPDIDFKLYLATLKADGLNYTRLFPGSYVEVPAKSFGIQRNDLAPEPGKFLAPWSRSETPGYAGGGNKFDLDHWNPTYFARLHDFLAEAERQGVIVEISLFSSQYGEPQWAVSPFNPANNVNGTSIADWKKLETIENGKILAYQEQYTRKLVHEAAAFSNVIFELQNEPWSDRPKLVDVINPYLFTGRDQYPNSVEIPDELSIAWQTRVAAWIADEEKPLPHKHLVAQNYTNFRFPVRRLIPGISIVNFHYAYPDAVTLNYGLDKAIAYDETGFLGQDDAAYRRQAWNFLLSGGSTFDGLDYSFSPGHSAGDDTAPNGPGGGSPAFRKQLGILVQFLATLPLERMHPDTHTVLHAEGSVPRVLSDGATNWGIYLDGKNEAASELKLDLPSGEYTADWLDVVTGETTQHAAFHQTGGEKSIQAPPYPAGIALRITRTNR